MSNSAELAALKRDILSALNIRQYYESQIGEKLKAKGDGWSEHVHCPIHQDTGKPNLSINVNTGGFKCFACGVGGSAFDFWCFTHGLDPKTGFQEAITTLATQAGIDIAKWKSGLTHRSYVAAPIDSSKESIDSAPTYAPSINKAEELDKTREPFKPELVKGYQKKLTPEHYRYLHFHRGFTDDTISRYMIGWNAKVKYKTKDGEWKQGRFSIPIPDLNGDIRNIRGHAADAEGKMVNTKGFGSPSRLFPLFELIKNNPKNILFLEGEFDAMITNQKLTEAGLLDWLAMSGTSGCNTWEVEWNKYFYGRNFYIVFDVDAAGKRWAITHATNHLLPMFKGGKLLDFKIIDLPLDGSKEYKDATDWFVKLNGNIIDLIRLIYDTKPLTKSEGSNQDASVEPEEVKDFISCILDREYIDRHVRVPITISGESTKLYHATRTYRVTSCPLRGNDCCTEDSAMGTIPYSDVSFIDCCMANKKKLSMTLQDIACSKGKKCTVEEVTKVVMQEYFAHQTVNQLTTEEDGEGRMRNTQELKTAPVYIIQPEQHLDISPQDYIATGYIRSHPETRQVAFLIEHLEPLEQDWSKFKVTSETIQNLKMIQSFPNVKKILDEITIGVTQIYESDDILLTVLLTYLSPIRFAFNGQIISGWINACIIGDSGTGKSATYKRFSDWVQLGDLFSALSGSRTGLLYAIKQRGVEWYVEVGRYVHASGKIIAIDETQEIEAEEIKQMAIAMTTGFLNVSRVASGGYRTETRTLFLMNPKYGKKISDYQYGCQSLTECFDPMHIRRLDIAIFTIGSEDSKFYNKKHDPSLLAQTTIKAVDFKTLIHWAWTRKIDDIQWSDESTNACLEKAVEMASIYGSTDDVPLVCPQDFRENLARISTAFAVLSGSFTDDYEGVVVTVKHVELMARFIDTCYSSAGCNLKQYAKQTGKKKTLEDFDTINEGFKTIIDRARYSSEKHISESQHFLHLIVLIQYQSHFRKRDAMDQISVSDKWMQKHLAILLMHNLIEIYKGGYRATRKFNLFIRKWTEDQENAEILESVHAKLGQLAMLTKNEPDFHEQYVDYRQHREHREHDGYTS